jgi:type VI secretion system protein ImpJ
MFSRNRVIWNEGLFIKPQHFQQQQRYLEYYVEQRIRSVNKYLYGVSELSFNPEYLSFGRIAIESISGVMPDGTVFLIPQEDSMPKPIEVQDASLANQLIYLAIPLRSESLLEVDWPEEKGSGRYGYRHQDIRDVHTCQGDSTTVGVSPVQVKLMLENEDRSAYASIAIARIFEKRPDGSVILDPDFIPCNLDVSCHSGLHRFASEFSGLMLARAKSIAQRIGSPTQGSVADVSDFMLLQTLNRLQPQILFLGQLRSLHPARFFEYLASVCGELATFTDESRLPPTIPSYNHDLPSESFWPLIQYLRQSLSIVLEARAVAIQMDRRKYGLTVAPVQDADLIDNAEFIIAVKARMPLEDIRRLFTQQTKVSSVDKIRDLISHQLPGIPLTPLPVAPRQLPYHVGYTYYQLDKTSRAWDVMHNSSGFAFHVAAAFDELEMQFWAIRR